MSARPTLDEADKRLLQALRDDPRSTNTALAQKLSLTETVVANRIKSLEARDAMRVVAQLDFRALGYEVLALVDVRVVNGKSEQVTEALARLERVGSVSVMFGHPSFILQVQAEDLGSLETLLLSELASIPGVEDIETNLIIDVVKWNSGSGRLAISHRGS